MSTSRRGFLRTLGVGGAGVLTYPAWASARGLEAVTAHPATADLLTQQGAMIRLMSNENPYGPVKAAIDAMTANFQKAAWYPASMERSVKDAIARVSGVPTEQIMLGSGSGEILRLSVQAFCSPTKHLVSSPTTFEQSGGFARTLGFPVKDIPVKADLSLDLARMAEAAKGAGLVYFCNPNNPTGHVVGKTESEAFVRACLDADPEVVVLVDQAYHEFVDTPSYASLTPMIASHPRVFVAHTFSKIYGLAGMRIGYAFGQPAMLGKMERLRLNNGIGALAQVAAIASVENPTALREQQRLNREARTFTTKFFQDAGYDVVPSDANFIFVNIKRDTRQFADACRQQGVMVGRPFPPFLQHSRISIGTMAEMRTATQVFQRVLSAASN